MKLTNADLIRNREKELLVTISGDLDRKGIKQLLEAKYQLELDAESLECRDGDLVVHDNQVAYKVKFQAMVSLALLFDREGECLETDLFTAVTESAGQRTSVSTGRETDKAGSDSGSYSYTSSGQASDEDLFAGDDVSPGLDMNADAPDSGAYAAVTAEPAGDEAAAKETAEEKSVAGDDAPPTARMASSIAEMISEINKT